MIGFRLNASNNVNIYNYARITCSLAESVLIWKPTAQSSGATFTPTTSDKTVYNNASGTIITNIILYTDMAKNLSKRTDVTYFIPSSSERETRLMELSLLFGIIGSSVHGVSYSMA
jgi:hypothetical protein